MFPPVIRVGLFVFCIRFPALSRTFFALNMALRPSSTIAGASGGDSEPDE